MGIVNSGCGFSGLLPFTNLYFFSGYQELRQSPIHFVDDKSILSLFKLTFVASHNQKYSANGGCEIVGYAHPGVPCKADSLIVELAAQILATLRTEEWGNSATLLIRSESVLGKLGMSPAGRSKVSIFKKQGPNPYAEFG
ncbi:hypothetical protein [Nitrosospira sp. NpAV]|uniref:hypothetical protein n=1 Tax=Nitrosospira sp. NpAV TaxID=58133 RepID=UPI000697B957|nr:hypothetical protein [Nitrosospira sp. NpAV]